MKITTAIKEIWRGKDIYRLFMNEECGRHAISGRVLDVGSGKTKASYHRFFKQGPDTKFSYLDLGFENGGGDGKYIDLETDPLPPNSESIDTVLLCNVLEHIYNDRHVLGEIKRVLKSSGTLLGVVPFLVGYHPDPHDYWRYTSEALQKVFAANGFSSIKITPFGLGPFVAGWSHIEVVVPRVLKIACLPGIFLLDKCVLALRPKFGKEKFPLGLFFEVKK